MAFMLPHARQRSLRRRRYACGSCHGRVQSIHTYHTYLEILLAKSFAEEGYCKRLMLFGDEVHH